MRATCFAVNFSVWSGGGRRSIDQVWLIGAPDGAGCTGAVAAAQLPLTLEITFGGLPVPCDTIWVLRVQVPLPLV
jgi:hypothetical protein